MWTTRFTDFSGGVRVEVGHGSDPARHVDVIDAWCRDPEFCSWFSSVLASSPFDAFRWETPAVTAATATQPFEFVLLDAPGLAPHPNPAPFDESVQRQSQRRGARVLEPWR
jgi:hypothetical protein